MAPKNIAVKLMVGIGICLFLTIQPVMSSWEFAVTTPNKINFFDKNWTITTSAAHQFEQLSAINYDEIDNIIYFNDQAHSNSTIFSLKLSDHRYNHQIEEILVKKRDEQIQGIGFDPLEKMLYWTDAKNNHIYAMSVDKKEDPRILIKLDASKSPEGIAVDVCRRKIYWTTANYMSASIQRSSMDGSKQEILIDQDLSMPSGIVVDQQSKRIYWVDSFLGNKYTIESAALNGTDRVKLISNYYNLPTGLTVDDEYVYWTDAMYNSVWRIPKNRTSEMPENVYKFTSNPRGIISKSKLIDSQTENVDCRATIREIELRRPAVTTTEIPTSTTPAQLPNIICLNNGIFDKTLDKCICNNEFKGRYCETAVCYNYCLQGTCRVSSSGYPQCTCDEGFEGERCDRDLCNGFCLNGGRCSLENQEPICKCPASFHGAHCEAMNFRNLCQNYCENGINNIEDFNLPEICGNCSEPSFADKFPQTFATFRSAECSASKLNKTAAFVSCGVVIALGLVFLIVKTLKRHYKPLRPKIRKTFLVRKNVSKTPLTCRPTTEQCEITIEDCCNMNICDTPCFDPETLQHELSKKEDKKSLVNNMEGELY